jgi:hypothetical protein
MWMDLYRKVDQHRNQALAHADGIVLAILAGESATLFGRRVEFSLSWPDGLPLGMADEAELREWAASELAKVRERELAAIRGMS